jgi:hypothetical protein
MGTTIWLTTFQPFFYTKGVEAHWLDAKVGEHGELVLENLPFPPGLSVEVLVVPRLARQDGVPDTGLRDSVVEYRDPFEPVAGADWDVLR